MYHKRGIWLSQIKAVEREHQAVQLATDRLLENAGDDPSILEAGLSLRDILSASKKLEGTYVIRLFAEFETGLRSCWTGVRGTDPPSRAVDLINGTAAKQRIPFDYVDHVHSIRNHRNALIHEREEVGDPIPIGKACEGLYKFFSRLPYHW